MRALILISGLLLLAGCSWLPDHRLDYRQAEPLAPVSLPEGMTLVGEQPLYVVPEAERRLAYSEGDEFEVPRPPDLEVTRREQEEGAPDGQSDPTNTRVVLARDGSGYPMIMMHTSYAWAWEYVGQALAGTDLTVDDRDRQSGIFYLNVPAHYGLEDKVAQLKLSQTANGVQITVLRSKEGVLAAKGPGQDMLQALYEQL